MQNNIKLIQQYYDYFNAGNLEAFMGLLDEQVIHDINQGETQLGKERFYKFMQHMQRCYDEKINQLIIMANENASQLATKFIVEGTYIATDGDLISANRQPYRLVGGAFFEIINQKITRVTSYYNMNKWLEQVKN